MRTWIIGGFGLWVVAQLWAASALPLQEQMQFADGLFAREWYDWAREEYLAIVLADESFDQLDVVLYRLGECFRRTDQVAAAERFYVRVLREFPDSELVPRAFFRRAQGILHQGRTAEAHLLLSRFLEGSPPVALIPAALYYRGEAAVVLGRTADAEAAWRRVLVHYPEHPLTPFARLELAALLRREGDWERQEEARALYGELIESSVEPGAQAEALRQQADWFFQQGAYEQAYGWYAVLHRDHAGSASAERARLSAAWAGYHVGQYVQALTLAEAVLQEMNEPAGDLREAADWLYLKANLQRQLLRHEEARGTYAQLIEQYSDHALVPVARYELMLSQFRSGAPEETIRLADGTDWGEVPLQPEVYWLLAESYAELGRIDEAVQYYRKVIDQAPEEDRAAHARYRLGMVLQERGDHHRAVEALMTVSRDFPENEWAAHAMLAQGQSLMELEQQGDALNVWHQLLARYAEHSLAAETRLRIALVRLREDDRLAAQKALEAVWQRHPGTVYAAEALYWSGVRHEQDEEWGAAEAVYRAVLQTDGDGSERFRNRARDRLIRVLRRHGAEAAAAKEIEEWLQLDDGGAAALSWGVWSWLADYQVRQGNGSGARRAARLARARAVSAAELQTAWMLYGRAALLEDDSLSARSAFEQSIGQDAATRARSEAAYWLGTLDLQDGLVHEAERRYTQVVQWADSEVDVAIRARAYLGLGRVAERQEDWASAARYYATVGILFDDEHIVPEALAGAVRVLGHAGRETEQQRTKEELRRRYPAVAEEWLSAIQ